MSFFELKPPSFTKSESSTVYFVLAKKSGNPLKTKLGKQKSGNL